MVRRSKRLDAAAAGAAAAALCLGLTWGSAAAALGMAAAMDALAVAVGGGAGTRRAGENAGTDGAMKVATTMHRAAMLMLTCACIHVVDYEGVFPQRYRKANAFGAGLMDVGSGSFVFAAGFVASRQRAKSGANKALTSLALGGGRWALVRASNYAVPPEEYGRDWNFFVTLAGVQVLRDALAFVPPIVAAVATLAVHEGLFLRLCDGYEYVHRDAEQADATAGWGEWLGLAARRPPANVFHGMHVPELLHANKEGAGSLLGYAALFFAAAALGQACRRWEAYRPDAVVLRLIIFAVGCYACIIALGGSEVISRRACNLSYVLWMLAYNATVLAVFRAAAPHIAARWPFASSDVLACINRHMLALFLGANLLTGILKLSAVASPDREARFAYGAGIAYGVLVAEGAAWLDAHYQSGRDM